MKHFLYLDTDIVNSIIAQSNKGLVTQETTEKGRDKNEGQDFNAALSGDVSGSGNLFTLAKAEAKIQGELGQTNHSNVSSSTKDVIEKILHDASFDIAYGIIQPKIISMDKDDCEGEGTYVELNRVFDFVDFEYLSRFFERNGVIDFVKKQEEEKAKVQAIMLSNEMNREQRRKPGNEIQKKIKELTDAKTKQFEMIETIISVVRSFVPYDRMLLAYDGFLIPVEDRYFRVNPKTLGFTYGGSITCVGMVTNLIGEDTDPNDSKNVFANVKFQANEVLRKLLPTKETNIWVVHPIALYYEN